MNSKRNWQDTSTLASLMLGELVQKEWPLGQSILRNEFTGGLEREYEGLSALLERHCPEDLREAILNRVDGLLRLCMRRGLEAGCRAGGVSLAHVHTSEAEE